MEEQTIEKTQDKRSLRESGPSDTGPRPLETSSTNMRKKNPGMSEAMKAAWVRRKAEKDELEKLRAENAELLRAQQAQARAQKKTREKKKVPIRKQSLDESGRGDGKQTAEEEEEEEDDDDDGGFVQKKAKKVDKTVHHLQQVEQRLHHLHMQQAARVNPFLQLLSQR